MPLSPFLPAGAATSFQQALAQKQQQNPLVPAQPTPDPNANMAQWDKFLTALTEPGTMSALVDFGARALQPRARGQTQGGHLGQAIAGTLGDQRKLQAAESEDQRQQALLDLKDRQVSVQERGADIREQQQSLLEEQQPLTLDKLRADIELAKARARTAGATEAGATQQVIERLAGAFYRANPGRFDSQDDAFIYAAQIWKATQGKSREDRYQIWLEKLTELTTPKEAQDPAYWEEQKKMAWELANSADEFTAPKQQQAPAGTATPQAPQAPQAPQESQAMPELGGYAASEHPGAALVDDSTGTRYVSDGTNWVPETAPAQQEVNRGVSTTRRARREAR